MNKYRNLNNQLYLANGKYPVLASKYNQTLDYVLVSSSLFYDFKIPLEFQPFSSYTFAPTFKDSFSNAQCLISALPSNRWKWSPWFRIDPKFANTYSWLYTCYYLQRNYLKIKFTSKTTKNAIHRQLNLFTLGCISFSFNYENWFSYIKNPVISLLLFPITEFNLVQFVKDTRRISRWPFENSLSDFLFKFFKQINPIKKKRKYNAILVDAAFGVASVVYAFKRSFALIRKFRFPHFHYKRKIYRSLNLDPIVLLPETRKLFNPLNYFSKLPRNSIFRNVKSKFRNRKKFREYLYKYKIWWFEKYSGYLISKRVVRVGYKKCFNKMFARLRIRLKAFKNSRKSKACLRKLRKCILAKYTRRRWGKQMKYLRGEGRRALKLKLTFKARFSKDLKKNEHKFWNIRRFRRIRRYLFYIFGLRVRIINLYSRLVVFLNFVHNYLFRFSRVISHTNVTKKVLYQFTRFFKFFRGLNFNQNYSSHFKNIILNFKPFVLNFKFWVFQNSVYAGKYWRNFYSFKDFTSGYYFLNLNFKYRRLAQYKKYLSSAIFSFFKPTKILITSLFKLSNLHVGNRRKRLTYKYKRHVYRKFGRSPVRINVQFPHFSITPGIEKFYPNYIIQAEKFSKNVRARSYPWFAQLITSYRA